MPALTAANLLAWSIQVAALVLVAGAGIRAARLRSPGVRLACFRTLLVACLVLPFVQPAVAPPTDGRAVARATGSSAPRAGVSTEIAASVDVTPATSSPQDGPIGRAPWLPAWAVSAAIALLAVGAAARFAWLAVGLVALRRLRRRASPVGLALEPGGYDPLDRAIDFAGARAEILTSPAVKHPVTFGFFRPVVLLPESYASLDETAQVAVVCHELLHVRRLDWLHIVTEELLRGILWFNPAIWWLLAQIDLGREQVVDQEVVELTERRQPYVNALVALALSPPGPVLRPASLFLGRAHLLQRVALLSREASMSRPRLVASVALIAAALLFGGQIVVGAFPLRAAAAPDAIATPAVPAPASGPSRIPESPGLALGAQGSPIDVRPEPAARPAPVQEATRNGTVSVLQRAEPAPVTQPGEQLADAIVAVQVTINPDGTLSGPYRMTGIGPDRTSTGKYQEVSAAAADGAVLTRILSEAWIRSEPGDGPAPAQMERLRAAHDAVTRWRFQGGGEPITTVIGFNFARTDQSGPESEPLRVGGNVPPPRKLKDVRPSYPAAAHAAGVQGVVIMELVIDGAGIPVSAYAIRPIDTLTMAAVQAALQWRFTPDPANPRRLVTVTVNFTLDGNAATPPPPPPPPPTGGVPGGVVGGVASGVPGGVVGGVAGGGVVGGVAELPSFGPPPSQWPAYARVGGAILQPRKLVDVRPVYPREAQDASVQGVVIVEALIGPDGKVLAARILRSIPLLNQASIDAVSQWEFTPTLVDGVPMPVVMTVTVNFTLS